MSQMPKEFSFVCCFCCHPIRESYIDPCHFDLVTNKNDESVHFLACHYHCVKEKVHETMKGYFVQDIDDNDQMHDDHNETQISS